MARRTFVGVSLGVLLAAFFASQSSRAQAPAGQIGLVVGRNVNMVSGTGLPDGDPFLQRQNEPSIAASTRNPLHLVGGANDYRTVDLPGMLDDIETGDAWLSVFKSFDGGQRWQSTLLPGYPQDATPEGLSSPLNGYQAGADPVVRAGTNGLVYYGGLVFNRTGQTRSAVFVARFIDNNNKENGDPVAYLGTSVVASDEGTGDRFLDKPWIAVDVPRGKSPACRIVTPAAAGAAPIAPQTIAPGNVYAAYTLITGPSESPDRADIYFSTSSDCGETWSPPVRLSRDEDRINQGATIAIDPRNGHVYVAWRRIGLGNEDADAFMVTRSTTLGRKFSNPGAARRFPRGKALGLDPARYFEHRKVQEPVVVSDEAEFDQPTRADWLMFRTNAYPSMTVDGAGRVYMAWTERGFATMRPDPVSGDARVVVATSPDGRSWTPPAVVEDTAEPGHQIMPTIGIGGGRLTLAYYDLREDRSQVFTATVDDRTATTVLQPDGTHRRHTIDLRAVMGTPGEAPEFEPSTRVSEYRIGTLPDETGPARQLQWNPPNLPIFRLGTVPFIGDYIDLTPAPVFVQGANGRWEHNTAAAVAPVFHAVWTDNRDVRAPVNGDWTSYTPPFSEFTGQACVSGRAGMRNQNVYTARLTRGLLAGSPGNTKPLEPDLPRGFVVFAQNTTDQVRTFRLSILDQPPGGWASFLQDPASLLVWVDATVPPRSVVSRTVYVTSTDPHARVSIDVAEIAAPGAPAPVPDGLRSQVILNPDISNPDISNPDISNPDISNPDISNAEVYNPDISNPDISNPDISNPDISNPDISNPDISNVELANPDISNPDISNPDISNPDISNPDISNPDISNPDISNGALTDVTWTVTNTGNTSATFDVDLFLRQATVPEGIKVQLVLHRVYKTPVADGCDLKTEAHNVLVANIVDPAFRTGDPGAVAPDPANPDISNATLWIEPGGQAKITLRVLDTDPTDGNTLDPLTDVTPVVTSEAVNTPDLGTPAAEQPADWPGATPSSSTLTFLTQPSSVPLGMSIVPAVRVEVRDSLGALAGVTVTLALMANPEGAHLTGTVTTATDDAGVATFWGLQIDREGFGYRLVASSGSTDGAPIVTDPFAILAGCVLASAPVESHVEGADIDSRPFALREAVNIGGDAFRDMVVLHENGLVTLMTGTGTGTFDISFQTPIPGGSGPRALAVADLNGDRNSDVVVAYATSANVGLMLGDGAGFVLGPPVVVPAGGAVHDVVVGQFNPAIDAYPDLALTFEDGSDVRLLLGDGAGGFGPPQAVAAVGAASGALGVGRMNPGPSDDLIVATSGAPGEVTVLLSGGDGTFTPASTTSVGFDLAGVAVADVDGNGRSDVAVADPASDAVHRLLGDGTGGLAPATSFPVGGGPRSIVAGYFDSNGTIDLATANRDNDSFSILFNDAYGGFAGPAYWVAGDEPSGITAGDFNGDGAMDVAVANRVRSGLYETISVLVSPCTPGATTVTNTNDSGPGSLREAILRANANPRFIDAVAFQIGGAGPYTIAPATPLPSISDSIVIDATTQPGFAGTPVVELNGANAATYANGLIVSAGNSLVRGLVINRFVGSGIRLSGGGSTIAGNYIGTDASGTVVLGNGDRGIWVMGASRSVVGGTSAADRNVISGNRFGVWIDGSTGVAVRGNYIGTGSAGTAALPNAYEGVYITGASNNTVGGVNPGEGNVISGNGGGGVAISQSTDNVVAGNFIGTDAAGEAAVPNGGIGVGVSGNDNTIGGGEPSARNVISGNLNSGIYIADYMGIASDGNVIQGNFVGTNGAGTAALPNVGGIWINSAGGTLIGGTAPGGGNVISGNDGDGIGVMGSGTGNVVAGNLIGTNAAGTAALGNAGRGLVVGAPGTTIGGTVPGARNVVSGNGAGMVIGGDAVVVRGNDVGLNAAGSGAIPNLWVGIWISAGTGTSVRDNRISGNGGPGIRITDTARLAQVNENAISDNAGLGIDLGGDGVTPNDEGDGDTGPNDLQNFPVLTSAETDGSTLLVNGSVDVGVNGQVYVEFFASPTCDPSGYGEGAQYLGYTVVSTSGTGLGSFTGVSLPPVSPGWHVTATARLSGTSEFSACREVTSTTTMTFASLPSGATAGTPFSVTVHVEDNTGSPLPGVTVSLAIGSGPTGAVLSGGTILWTDPSGNATFTGLSLNLPGTYTLVATSGSVTVTSIPFVVSP